MKLATSNARDMESQGHRLDASYHASEGIKALRFIHHWANQQPSKQSDANMLALRETAVSYNARKIDRLSEMCNPGGIFIPGRFKRYYVNTSEHGERWLSPSDMLKADLNDLSLVSRKYTPALDRLRIHHRWILLSRSGTIGNSTYVRSDMEGLVASDDIIRISVDEDKIPSGYLYAFISGSIGQALIQQQTYGAVIQHIEVHHIQDLPIPRLSAPIEAKIHSLIERASALRVEANSQLRSVSNDICQFFTLPKEFKTIHDHSFALGCISVPFDKHYRLDAFNYIGYAGEALQAIKNIAVPIRKLSEITLEIFNAPIFKRVYVGPEGMPYLMGYEVYQNNPSPSRFISRNTSDLERYVLREGMIIVQDSGSRNGLLGTPIYANRTLDGCAATNNMIRIVSPDKQIAGYIYAFLSTEMGQRLIMRESYGSTIPHIFPAWLGDISIPWPDEDIRNRFGWQVMSAFEYRAQANELENEAHAILEDSLKV